MRTEAATRNIRDLAERMLGEVALLGRAGTDGSPAAERSRLSRGGLPNRLNITKFLRRGTNRAQLRLARAFTLVEVLAALMLMAIVVPVTMQGLGIANRVGVLGQRKAAAMRVADRLLNEIVITGDTSQAGSNGSVADGDTVYPWTLATETWDEDAMTSLTVTVTYTVQGDSFTVVLSTLIDPNANSAATTAGTTP